jgi:FkbM family methyltransferase
MYPTRSIARPLIWLNLLPLWKRRVRVGKNEMESVTLDRFVYLHLHRMGLMGRGEKALFNECVRPGMRVLDIGANVGLYTLLFSRLVGESGEVIAFEPDPELFAALETNCCLNSATNVRLYNMAAGSHSGRMVLSRSLLNSGDNRLATVPGQVIKRSVDVRVRALDEIVCGSRVDFVKIDVQGWEAEVLAGMKRILDSNPALQICFEYWPQGLRNAGCDPSALLGGMAERGFRFEEITGRGRVPVTDLSDWPAPTGDSYTNIYAVRSEYTDRQESRTRLVS